MAAYAALLSLAQTLDLMLHQDQHRVLIEHEQITVQIIQSLQQKISSLESFLKNFPPKLTVKLEGRIRDVGYEAEDIIDNFVTSKLHPNFSSNERNLKDLVKVSFRHFRSDYYLERLCRDLQKASRKIDGILQQVEEMKISSGVEESARTTHTAAGSSKQSRKEAMVGFEDEVMALKLRLCGESSKREIIPIVGMGGSGKTTLARHLYDDKLTLEMFDFRGWVTISQEYRVHDILQQLLSFKKPSNMDETGSLIVRLFQNLKGRKYLIILDDIWGGEAWDAVRRAFPDDNNGSRIILTTREGDVASYVDSSTPLHQMHLLDDDQSWDLLQKKVFGHESCPPELEEMGRVISRNCKGLPLVIVVIAGVLAAERTVIHWKNVAENVMSSVLSSRSDDIFELLSLSYTHLPCHLKPCILYLGVFPEDHQIDVSELVRLWIAEGFIEPNASRTLEEVAKEYWKDLVKRNLVLAGPKGYFNLKGPRRYFVEKTKYCSIHDVLRELLCIKRAKEERFFIRLIDYHTKIERASRNQRRITTHRYIYKWDRSERIYGSQVRSVLFFKNDEKLKWCVRRFRLLRVLEAEHAGYETDCELMDEIGELFHLRYLSLSTRWSSSIRLPSIQLSQPIRKLFNLQTLILFGFERDLSLPIEIWGMTQLRHLNLITVTPWGCFILPAPPTTGTVNGKRCHMPNLQTLFTVQNLIWSKEIVMMMPNLKELRLEYSGRGSAMQEALNQLKYIRLMTQLQTLDLRIKQMDDDGSFWNPTPLCFPATLTSLRLHSCTLPCESMTVIGSLPNLKLLVLQDSSIEGEEWETNEGEFSRLKVLSMWYLNLRHWTVAESTHFPSLKYLRIHGCENLEEIPDSIGEISTLEKIEVFHCSGSVGASARKIQEEQQSFGNDLLQVSVKFSPFKFDDLIKREATWPKQGSAEFNNPI